MLPKNLIELAHRANQKEQSKFQPTGLLNFTRVYPIALKLRLSLYLPVAQAVTERYTRNFTCKHDFFNFSQDVSVDFGKTLCYGKDHITRLPQDLSSPIPILTAFVLQSCAFYIPL